MRDHDIQSAVNTANGKTQIRVNVWEHDSVKCDACGHDIFVPASIFKRIPGLLVGTGAKEHIQPVPVYICAKCGDLMPVYKEDIKQASQKTPDSSLFVP